MPELPEVETVVRSLRPLLLGRTILSVESDWPRHLANPDLLEFQRRIKDRKIRSIQRRGKYLVIYLDENEILIVHLKMTGMLSISPTQKSENSHVHTFFKLDGGEFLQFRDVRKFGRIYLVKDSDTVLGGLGPEPLEEDFTPDLLYKMLNKRKRQLKPLLLDQTFIAGLGNIYADEALFLAAVHPGRISNTLTGSESIALHHGIQRVLQEAIRREGASVNSYRKPDGSSGDMQNSLLAYGRTGLACQRCGSTIERIILGGRSTHFCPDCQL